MLTHLGIIVFLSIINGFFALSEMAVIASRKSRLKQLAKTSTKARQAIAFAEHPDQFLSSIQVGITLTMLLTGAVTGATLSQSISRILETGPLDWLVPYATSIGSIIGFVLATFIQIVIGELVPKRIALAAPERLASIIAYPMLIVSKITAPFVWLLNTASSALLRLLRIEQVSREKISEEEIRLLVAEGTEQGVLDDDERNMVNRVLHLGDRNVESVMTPRTRIIWLDIDAPLETTIDTLRQTHHSYYPVYRGSESDIVGVVGIKRLIDQVLNGNTHNPFANMTKPFYVPSSTRALDMLDTFRDNNLRMALAVDEYGDIDGLVTLNDLLASVIGKHSSAPDHDTLLWQQQADGSWIIDGSLAIDDVRELLALEHLPHESEHEFHTLGGMVVTTFGRIPGLGEMFAWQGLNFEVTALDGARIHKVRVSRVDDGSNADDADTDTTEALPPDADETA